VAWVVVDAVTVVLCLALALVARVDFCMSVIAFHAGVDFTGMRP